MTEWHKVFTFPNTDTSPNTPESKSHVQTSADNLVPKDGDHFHVIEVIWQQKVKTPNSSAAQYFPKYPRKLFLLKMETTKLVSLLQAQKTH